MVKSPPCCTQDEPQIPYCNSKGHSDITLPAPYHHTPFSQFLDWLWDKEEMIWVLFSILGEELLSLLELRLHSERTQLCIQSHSSAAKCLPSFLNLPTNDRGCSGGCENPNLPPVQLVSKKYVSLPRIWDWCLNGYSLVGHEPVGSVTNSRSHQKHQTELSVHPTHKGNMEFLFPRKKQMNKPRLSPLKIHSRPSAFALPVSCLEGSQSGSGQFSLHSSHDSDANFRLTFSVNWTKQVSLRALFYFPLPYFK